MEIDAQLLKAKLKYHRRTYADMAKAFGVSHDTFSRWIREKAFTIKQVHILMEIVPLSMEEVQEIFFAKKKDAG